MNHTEPLIQPVPGDFFRMKAALLLVLLIAVLSLAACEVTLTPPSCDAQARLPTPISEADLARLEAIKDTISREALGSPLYPDLNMVDADETSGTVVVGSINPTPSLCDMLHERYGPLVEVIYHEPIELL